MLQRLRTYRLLSALVAVALLAGAGLPLVRYACGVAAEPATTTPVVAKADASSAAACQGAGGCLDASLEVSTTTTAAQAVDLGASCCTVETAERALAVVAPDVSLTHDLLPSAARLGAKALPHDFSFSASLTGHDRDVAASASVPVRLLTSVFLL